MQIRSLWAAAVGSQPLVFLLRVGRALLTAVTSAAAVY
jgi:hypothetical protein